VIADPITGAQLRDLPHQIVERLPGQCRKALAGADAERPVALLTGGQPAPGPVAVEGEPLAILAL
jgi:hypothetical protein